MTLVLVAAALVVQMVLWMRRHGRTLKHELQAGLSARQARGQLWACSRWRWSPWPAKGPRR